MLAPRIVTQMTNLVNLGRTKKGSSFPCAIQDPGTRLQKRESKHLLTGPQSTQFPLGSVFQEAWKFLHQVLPAFNAGSKHVTKCDAERGQDLALLLATVPCLFARPRSDRFHQVLCLHAAVVMQCSPVADAAGDPGAKVVLEGVFLRNSPQSYSTYSCRRWSESGNVP